MTTDPDLVDPVSEDEVRRVKRVLQSIEGRYVSWGAVNVLEVLLTERRMKADRMAAERLTRATWALVACTAALVASTIVLAVATING